MNALERLIAERSGAARPATPTAPAPTALQLLLERAGIGQDLFQEQVAQIATKTAKRPREVPDTTELRRVAWLPRRQVPSLAELNTLAEAYSSALRTLHGTQTLRPLQALALHELREVGGVFAPINVGGGKTLISWLAIAVTGARRPLVIVPAALKAKTKRDFRMYAQHWVGPPPDSVRVESYEWISKSGGVKLQEDGKQEAPGALERYAPDLLILDEVQKISRASAAVTRRFKRFMRAFPGTKVVALSGTITKRSLRDYAHVLEWCIPRECPLPTVWEHLKGVDETGQEVDYGRQDILGLWADALDEKVSPSRRLRPGALLQLASEKERQDALYGADLEIRVARRAFRSRLTETRGVVASKDSELPVSLSLKEWTWPETTSEAERTEELFRNLREAGLTPDGLVLPDPMQAWALARQLGQDFFYRWNPRPPDDWMDARRDWAVLCREIVKSNHRGLDTEAQVAQAVGRGIYPGGEILAKWRELRPTFEPRTEVVWIGDRALRAAMAWAAQGPGLIWVEHVEFALELARRSGLPYYGRKGVDARGRMLEDHPPAEPAIVGVQANSAGRNLQAWNRNLIMCPPPGGLTWEQLLGRTHRSGQESNVTADVWFGCLEHATGFWQAVADAAYVQDTTGQVQKLCIADMDIPEMDEIVDRGGFRWRK